MTRSEFAKSLGVGIDTVMRWDANCPYIEAPVGSWGKSSNERGSRVRSYTQAESNRVKQKMDEARTGRWVSPTTGRAWLSRDRSLKELNSLAFARRNVGRWGRKITKHTLGKWWAGDHCPHLPKGRRLTRKSLGFSINGGHPQKWSPEEEIFTIRDSVAKRAAGQLYDGVFHEPDGSKRFSLPRAGKESMFSTPTLYKFIEKLPAVFDGAFPGGKLPTELRPIPGRLRQEPATIAELDLLKLEEIVQEKSRQASKLPDHIQTLAGVFEKYDIQKILDRMSVARLLRTLRQQSLVRTVPGVLKGGKLNGETKTRPWPRSHEWSTVYFFDLQDLDRFLAGRSILDVAKERDEAEAAGFVWPPQAAPSKNGHVRTKGPLTKVEEAVLIKMREPNLSDRSIATIITSVTG